MIDTHNYISIHNCLWIRRGISITIQGLEKIHKKAITQHCKIDRISIPTIKTESINHYIKNVSVALIIWIMWVADASQKRKVKSKTITQSSKGSRISHYAEL